jgi:hypothetical protein
MSWVLGWNRLIDRCGNDDGALGREGQVIGLCFI